jgi:hypothetical protein
VTVDTWATEALPLELRRELLARDVEQLLLHGKAKRALRDPTTSVLDPQQFAVLLRSIGPLRLLCSPALFPFLQPAQRTLSTNSARLGLRLLLLLGRHLFGRRRLLLVGVHEGCWLKS